MRLEVRVEGTPVPKGSKNARVIPGEKPRAVLWDKNPKGLQEWETAVAEAVRSTGAVFPPDAPLRIDLAFYIARPASVKREFPSVAPDLDKLTRSTWDGIKKGGAIHDDARVVTATQKERYADHSPPGVLIRVTIQPSYREERE